MAAEPAAVRAQGDGAVPLGARRVRGAHATWDRHRSIRNSPRRSSTRSSLERQFFSGHTGLPFLAALAFWHILPWRLFYLALTVFFGAVVLLGHYHYSIDVLAALFITHGVFQMSCWLFGRDYALFRSSESQAAPKPKRGIRKRLFPGGRTSEPFVLHAVGDDPSSAQSKTRL